jgi:hypothetical protein
MHTLKEFFFKHTIHSTLTYERKSTPIFAAFLNENGKGCITLREILLSLGSPTNMDIHSFLLF